MTMKTKTRTAAAFLAGTALCALFASQAMAVNGYDYGDAHMNTNSIISTVNSGDARVISDITTQINAMQLALLEGLRLSTGQITGTIREQTAALHNLADLQDDRGVVSRVEAATLKAANQSASGASTCNVVTGATSGRGLRQLSNAVRQDATKEMVNWDLGEKGSPSEKGADVAVQMRVERHCAVYGTEQDVISGLCARDSVKADSALKNADVNVAQSLLYSDKGQTNTLSPERLAAARTFAVNAINPVPQGPMLPGSANTAAGREEAARRQASAARMSIANDTVNDMLSRRTADPNQSVVGANGQATGVNEWAEGLAGQILGYDPNGNNFPNGVSWHDWMEIRSRGWFMNPNWAIAADTQSAEQTTKDIAMMQAFEVYQNWETYQLLERINLNLATSLSIMNEASRNSAASGG